MTVDTTSRDAPAPAEAAEAVTPRLRRRPRRSLLTAAAPVLTVIALLLIWEAVVRVWDIEPFLLPPPSTILDSIVENRESLIRNSRPTLVAAAIGFGVGVGIGVVLAMLLVAVPLLKNVIYPVVVASQTVPKIALAPLFTLWFGIGLLPKVVIVALLVFFPVFVNTATGLDSVSKGRLDLMKSVDASRWQVYRHIQLPEAIPYFFAGLKLALTVAFIGVIVGEWIAASQGLGYLLVLYNATQDTAGLFAVIFMFVFLATATFYLLAWLERRLSWQARIQRSQQQ